jgi:hypothetical protein
LQATTASHRVQNRDSASQPQVPLTDLYLHDGETLGTAKGRRIETRRPKLGGERIYQGGPWRLQSTSIMATGVAGQNKARTTSTLKRGSYLPFLLFSHLPAFFCSSIPRFHNPPHPYHLTSSQIEAFLSFSKSSSNLPQIIQTSSWIPYLYIALTTCHSASTLSSHAPSLRRLKPLSLSLVYLSRKGFESQAP